MRLDYAFLAERASRLEDGRLVIFGGDVDAVEPAGLPAAFQSSLVARMLLEEGESAEGHEFSICVTLPDGSRTTILERRHLNAPRNIPAGMPGGAGLIVGLTIGLRQAGIYRIHLIVDGAELKALPLLVEQPPNAEQVPNDGENANATNDR
jgi:hypothetical protein